MMDWIDATTTDLTVVAGLVAVYLLAQWRYPNV